MTRTFGFKAWALVASLGLAATLVGCNPEEPAKPAGPPPSPPVAKAPSKAADTQGAAPAPVTPAPKKDAEK